jgi:hypothetical protein
VSVEEIISNPAESGEVADHLRENPAVSSGKSELFPQGKPRYSSSGLLTTITPESARLSDSLMQTGLGESDDFGSSLPTGVSAMFAFRVG